MDMLQFFLTTLLLLLSFVSCQTSSDDFYTLLDTDKSATTKDIRKAFKKMALKMHPDKNIDDPEADSKFIRINRAYEVLKDDELRKKYDQFGEEGLENNQSGRGYQSWSYYKDNFGIYDDDPEIITLSRTDFEASVSSGHTPWFINYYHPMCSHCHTLAPDWRWLSIELQGAVRIGAVNCDDEFHLCSEQGIHSYPTLLAYPGRDKFGFEKTRDNLVSFILGRLPTGHGIPVTTGMLHNMRQQLKITKSGKETDNERSLSSTKPWVLAYFHSAQKMEDYKIMLMKLAAIFAGVVSVGRVDCYQDANACASLNQTREGRTVMFYYPSSPVLGGATAVSDETAQDTAKEVLSLMPELPVMDAHQYKDTLQAVEQKSSRESAWLVQFTSDNDHVDDEYRKISGLVSPIPAHRVICSSLPDRDCDAILFLHKTPAFVLFKRGGGYEIHQGRLLAQDIANFAREAAAAPNYRTLTSKDFPSVLSQDAHWFVDFYAPWCPPCMRLLPQFRQASVIMNRTPASRPVKFGIIDCTAHSGLCSQFNVRSYPTTILYNNTTPHQYTGPHSPHHMVEFVKDTLNPTVVALTAATFLSLVLHRAADELWVVDFFAAWCGPCQAMAPEYRKFSRLINDNKKVFVASIDCATERELCQSQGVSSYPTIRLYATQQGTNRHSISTYSDYSRDAESFRRWLYTHLPSKVATLNDKTFEDVLRSEEPWLVDFFAPWCGHCHQFAPHFEDLATSLEGSVKFGKIDCQAYQWVCRGAGVNAYPNIVFYKGVDGKTSSHGGSSKKKTNKKDSDERQHPRGEMIQSLQPQAILAHIQFRLEELSIASPKLSSRQLRDEL